MTRAELEAIRSRCKAPTEAARHARTDIPALLAEVERQAALLERPTCAPPRRAAHPLLLAFADAVVAESAAYLQHPRDHAEPWRLTIVRLDARDAWLAAGGPLSSTLALTCSRCDDELVGRSG